MNNKKAFLIILSVSCLMIVLLGVYQRFVVPIRVLTSRDISALSPAVQKGSLIKQIDDYLFFNTKSKGYDKAIVTVQYISPDSNQDIYLGFRDSESWHYDIQPLSLHILNNLNWSMTGNGPWLYAKSGNLTLEDLLDGQHKDIQVGTYALRDETRSSQMLQKLENYTPGMSDTEFNTNIVGSSVIFAYVEDEPFRFELTKQDFNTIEGADPVTVRVLKDGKLLIEKIAADDGITDTSNSGSTEESVTIEFEGGFPPTGVYTIEIVGSQDSVVTHVKTNLRTLHFENVPNQSFQPFPYNYYEIKNTSDLDKVDYLLTDYKKTNTKDSFQEKTLAFDLRNAHFENGKLNWMLWSPGLKRNNREVYLVDIKIILKKD